MAADPMPIRSQLAGGKALLQIRGEETEINLSPFLLRRNTEDRRAPTTRRVGSANAAPFVEDQTRFSEA